MYFNFFASVWMKVWSILYLPWKTTTSLWNTEHTLKVWTLLLPYSLKTQGTKLDSTASKIIRPASIFSSFVQHLMLWGLVSVPHHPQKRVWRRREMIEIFFAGLCRALLHMYFVFLMPAHTSTHLHAPLPHAFKSGQAQWHSGLPFYLCLNASTPAPVGKESSQHACRDSTVGSWLLPSSAEAWLWPSSHHSPSSSTACYSWAHKGCRGPQMKS